MALGFPYCRTVVKLVRCAVWKFNVCVNRAQNSICHHKPVIESNNTNLALSCHIFHSSVSQIPTMWLSLIRMAPTRFLSSFFLSTWNFYVLNSALFRLPPHPPFIVTQRTIRVIIETWVCLFFYSLLCVKDLLLLIVCLSQNRLCLWPDLPRVKRRYVFDREERFNISNIWLRNHIEIRFRNIYVWFSRALCLDVVIMIWYW